MRCFDILGAPQLHAHSDVESFIGGVRWKGRALICAVNIWKEFQDYLTAPVTIKTAIPCSVTPVGLK